MLIALIKIQWIRNTAFVLFSILWRIYQLLDRAGCILDDDIHVEILDEYLDMLYTE